MELILDWKLRNFEMLRPVLTFNHVLNGDTIWKLAILQSFYNERSYSGDNFT